MGREGSLQGCRTSRCPTLGPGRHRALMEGHFHIGRYYEVPCVRASILPSRRAEWLPVLGPWHEDLEHFGFKEHHYHIDHRFAPRWLADQEGTSFAFSSNGGHEYLKYPFLLGRVIIEDAIFPDGGMQPPGQHPPRSLRWMRQQSHEDVPVESFLQVRRRKCKRAAPVWPDWLGAAKRESLEASMEGVCLKADMICPHRGADLSGIPPDAQGNVQCPLHGLKWHVATGTLVRTAGSQRSRNEEKKEAAASFNGQPRISEFKPRERQACRHTALTF